MALPVRQRDTAPQPFQRWDPFREVLTVRIPKPEQERPRRVDVRSA